MNNDDYKRDTQNKNSFIYSYLNNTPINVPSEEENIEVLDFDTELDKPVVETDLSHATEGLEKINTDNNTDKMKMEDLLKKTVAPKVEHEMKTRRQNKTFFVTSILAGASFVVIVLIAIFTKGTSFYVDSSEVYYENKKVEKVEEYQTAVVTDNIYKGVTVNNMSDAKKLIENDSTNQKAKCNNVKTKEVEKRIEKNYGITAINFCEMDYDFALEIENVIKTVYKEFPSIKGYITNITLINTPEFTNYIASFVSAKLFAKSNTKNTYPNVYKMSIFLNASYFLNKDYLTATVNDSASYGYFPSNATRYTIVAHELGHYLSFLAEMRSTTDLDSVLLLTKENYREYSNLISDSNNGVFSLKMINEAYESYNKSHKGEFSNADKFRESISEYAMATDANGSYIYDETIAEAFHDYYVNRTNAKPASKEIMKVLRKYLNKK